MPDLTPGMRTLSQAFGAIQRAASSKRGVAGAWAEYQAADVTVPEGGTRPTIQDMNSMYSLASHLRDAIGAFDAGALDQPIPARAVQQTWYSRSLESFSVTPSYDIRYQVTYTEGGQLQQRWLTYTRDLALPATKAALLDALEVHGTSALSEYGQGLIGIDAVSIAWT